MRRDQQRAESSVLQEDGVKIEEEQKRLQAKAAQMKGYLEVSFVAAFNLLTNTGCCSQRS